MEKISTEEKMTFLLAVMVLLIFIIIAIVAIVLGIRDWLTGDTFSGLSYLAFGVCVIGFILLFLKDE